MVRFAFCLKRFDLLTLVKCHSKCLKLTGEIRGMLAHLSFRVEINPLHKKAQ